ncbi:GntR family transcriptional regulator [Nocardioides sp. YIM 152315]|uniref:GntR family transcriptional regulator n=1 Tax=Nocardioides sp. YIM 152315 TaxID=3031760 RepID=UPI0023DB506D|nr:GntR family transcriptional regulator [Nocardioides sp. YIM 152315]MDF1602108.1 GntR family transcriptional regulator [Nocardioides sp. YIM 152315]
MATRRATTQSAYQQIRRAIVEGRYRPGQRLVEQRIGEEFDLSRTPVREALRQLEAEGLVHSEPNRGAVVREVSLDEISDLYDLRARLEGYAAELAAQRIGPAELERLDAGIAAFEHALGADWDDELDQVRAIDDANREVHGAVLAGARHDRLGRLLERTVDVPLVFQAFRQFDRAQTERSHLFHQLIRDAILAGDGQRASALMFEHVMLGRDVLLAHLEASEAQVDELFST